jgi:hypothetical protein
VYSRVLCTPFGSLDPYLKERNPRSDVEETRSAGTGQGIVPMLKRWRERRKLLELAKMLAELDALAEAR